MTSRALIDVVLVCLVVASAGPAFSGDGVVALVTCDVSCPDGSGAIFVGCGNGTVTDNRSGLVWLANANCFGQMNWDEAMQLVAGLGDLDCGEMDPDACDCGLADHSSPGEWRLPSMVELRQLTAVLKDVDHCSPTITNDLGNHCWDEECFELSTCSFYDVQSSSYWSSSSYVPGPTSSYVVDLGDAGLDLLAKEGYAYFWPVRGGQ